MTNQPKDFTHGNYHLPKGSYTVACTSAQLSDLLGHLASHGLRTGGLEQTVNAGSAGHLVVLDNHGRRVGAVVSEGTDPVYHLYLPPKSQ